MNKADFRVVYPECMVCMEPIKDDECYIFDGPGPVFDNCVCEACMKKERKKMKKNIDEAIFNDWDEYIFTRWKTTPVKIEEEF